MSHFDCFYVVYEVHTLLTGHFERYFNIIDGQTDGQTDRLTDGQKQSLNPASAYARGVMRLKALQPFPVSLGKSRAHVANIPMQSSRVPTEDKKIIYNS